MEVKQFVVVTDDPEFCLGTTLLYIDTRNTNWLFFTVYKEGKINYGSNINLLDIHHHGFQYIHVYKNYFISIYNNNAGIVGKIEILNNTNRDCRVIGLLI